MLAMVIMTDKPNKNAKNKGNLNPNEVSELLRNFYQPNEAGIQNFDDFYSQLRNKIDDSKAEIGNSSKRDQIQNDYEKREQQLKRMLADMDPTGRTTRKRQKARLMRFLVASACAGVLVAVGIFGYQFLHKGTANAAVTPEISATQVEQINQIEKEWQVNKTVMLAHIDTAQTKFDSEMQKASPDHDLVDEYERELLSAKAALSEARTQMLLAKKQVTAAV